MTDQRLTPEQEQRMTNRRGFLSSLMALTAAPLMPTKVPSAVPHTVTIDITHLNSIGRELAQVVVPFIPGEVRRLQLERPLERVTKPGYAWLDPTDIAGIPNG